MVAAMLDDDLPWEYSPNLNHKYLGEYCTWKKVPLGEDIHSTGENCVNLLRDRLSRLRENFESMCLSHSQWGTKCAHTGITYMVVNWVGQTTAREGSYFYLITVNHFS